ncbi:MAG: POTRA domain-containing protein [Muribaculaceae bacterium]|jgi:outer membrane protein insertion porin family|nr:outer membrane protein assembly factor BamA [Muribaculaceae bacterium]MEE0975906.1 POTRA domain-containing protein [Muribaculaceae bacterium]
MRYRLILLLAILSGIGFSAKSQVAAVDTIYNPNVIYTSMPRSYEIAGIKVTGADNYEDFIIIGYSGLKIGDRIEVPGEDIKMAARRFWRQALFSNVQIKVEKIAGDKVWLEFALRQQPRISSVNYVGVKKSEKEDLQERLQLMKGNQITQNIVNRATAIVKKYYADKGFKNAEVRIEQHEDISAQNEMIVDIIVDKHDKVKVNKIYIDGNEVLSDQKIQRAMKKTNEKNNILNLFRQKKFIESDYADDLNRILEKYNEKGYRDAKIVADSVVKFDEKTVDVYITVEEGKQYYISDIQWVGNTVYDTNVLNAILGITPGEVYNQKLLAKRTESDDDAVSNLYMNNGYLFYQMVPIEKNIKGDSIDLEMRIFEGPQARINKVVINGNDRLYEKVIRRELRVKPGELFSKNDLMRSAREIAQTGHFNPENMDIRPEPNEENGTVDILFNLESKANDQIEFSLGWGQTGIIGKLALKFTNFSVKNLLNPGSYKGVIPQGEGQTFTVSAQTNARYYQAYSIAFLDPWFGGKRPNSLSVSAYYSRQTGVNSSYYNDTWSNSYYSGYGYGYGYGYGSGYGSDYYQQTIENAYDPNKVLQMAGVTVGFGKRLNWPDDWFTFSAELSYNWYYLKNWDYLYYMNNGVSNSVVLGLTLARNSIDNPLYTRSGSSFQLSLHLTPPVSLFRDQNWEQLYNTNTEESKKEMYKWIEYWKLRFKSRTYTPLVNPDGQYTLVLMTRADFGLLGSYNKWLKSPFETFYVGGDGMTGSYTYATETIGLRGYDNGAFTPWGKEGYAYTRLGLELHFPFMLQPTTTIYGLVFAEGGNAWTDVKDFSPFNIKRSAGAGVRIYLPMVGMMGIDWAYGFDRVYGEKGGSHFHFILGQEF